MTRFNKSSWWPLKIERFDTSKHPVLTNRAPKAKEIQIRVSHNEYQIISGLANILECTPVQAIRIALASAQPEWDFITRGEDFDGKREKRMLIGVTQEEIALIESLRGVIGCTVSQLLRVVTYNVSQRIRAGALTRLPHCRRRSEKEKNDRWRRDEANLGNGGKMSTLKPLRDAAQVAWKEGTERNQKQYDELGLFVDNLRAEGVTVLIRNDLGMIDMDIARELHGADERYEADTAVDAIHRDPDKARAVEKLAKQFCSWMDDDPSNWRKYIEEAEADYDANRPLSDEEYAALEAEIDWL